MKKGIAIHTILLLIVGTITSGVVVYQTYTSLTGSALGERQCTQKMSSWCEICENRGWSGDFGMDTELSECANKFWGISHTDCNARDDCAGFLPSMGGGVTTTTSSGATTSTTSSSTTSTSTTSTSTTSTTSSTTTTTGGTTTTLPPMICTDYPLQYCADSCNPGDFKGLGTCPGEQLCCLPGPPFPT